MALELRFGLRNSQSGVISLGRELDCWMPATMSAGVANLFLKIRVQLQDSICSEKPADCFASGLLELKHGSGPAEEWYRLRLTF